MNHTCRKERCASTAPEWCGGRGSQVVLVSIEISKQLDLLENNMLDPLQSWKIISCTLNKDI